MKRLCQIAGAIIVIGIVACIVGALFGGASQKSSFSGLLDLPALISSAVTDSDETDASDWTEMDLTGTDDVSALSLDIDGAILTIRTGDDWSLKSNKNGRGLEYSTSGNTFFLNQEALPRWWKQNKGPQLVLTVPSDVTFDTIDASFDGVVFSMPDAVSAGKVTLDADGASLEIKNLDADSLDLDGDGAEVQLSACLREDSSIDADGATVTLELLDGSTISNVNTEFNLSTFTLNGTEYGDGLSGTIEKSIGTAKKGGTLSITCDAGCIELTTP